MKPTEEQVIAWAQEAGLHIATDVHWMPIIGLEYAQKFAAIVAAAEREACAQIAFNAKTYLEAAAAIRARREHG